MIEVATRLYKKLQLDLVLRRPENSATEENCVRGLIGLRSGSGRIAYAARSDSVRGPIRLRTVSESVADAVEKICCGFRAQKKV